MTQSFTVEGMHCQACVKRVVKALESASPGARVEVDLAAGKVMVAAQATRPALAAAITRAGYTVKD